MYRLQCDCVCYILRVGLHFAYFVTKFARWPWIYFWASHAWCSAWQSRRREKVLSLATPTRRAHAYKSTKTKTERTLLCRVDIDDADGWYSNVRCHFICTGYETTYTAHDYTLDAYETCWQVVWVCVSRCTANVDVSTQCQQCTRWLANGTCACYVGLAPANTVRIFFLSYLRHLAILSDTTQVSLLSICYV